MATATEELAQELLGGARGANSFLFQHSYLAAYDFDSARKILLHSNYEGTDLEELARDIGFRPVDQTDAGKLAREVDQPPACDNGMVSNQKEALKGGGRGGARAPSTS